MSDEAEVGQMSAFGAEEKKIVMDEGDCSEVTENSNYDVLLKEYEELFKDRYMEKDEQYVSSLETIGSPPIVHPWYNKSRRNFDYTRSRGGHEGHHYRNQRGGGGRDRWSAHRYQPYQNNQYARRHY